MSTCPSSPSALSKTSLPNHENNILQLQQLILFQKQHLMFQSQQMALQSQQIHSLTQQNHYLNSQVQFLQLQVNLNLHSEAFKYKDLIIEDLSREFTANFQSQATQQTYREGFSQLFEQGFLQRKMTLEEFRKINGDHLLDQVRLYYKRKDPKSKKFLPATESTKQLRAAMLISFSSYLQRRTEGYIKKIVPNKFGFNKTFMFSRKKSCATLLTSEEINSFLSGLKSFSLKAFLFASLQLIGVKRVSEVRNLNLEDLDLQNNRVIFRQLKTKGSFKEPIIIYLPERLADQLKEYVQKRTRGPVFIDQAIKSEEEKDSMSRITTAQVQKLYSRAWRLLGKQGLLKPRMITHCLRAAGISYLYEKNIDTQLIKDISGHASGDMVMYYNLKSKYENISKKIHIIDLP